MANGVRPPVRRDCIVKELKWPASMRATMGTQTENKKSVKGGMDGKCPNNPQHTGPDLPQHIVGARTTLSVSFCCLLCFVLFPFFSRITLQLPPSSLSLNRNKIKHICRFHRVCNVFCSVPFANHLKKYIHTPTNTSILASTDRSSSHRGLLINCSSSGSTCDQLNYATLLLILNLILFLWNPFFLAHMTRLSPSYASQAFPPENVPPNATFSHCQVCSQVHHPL